MGGSRAGRTEDRTLIFLSVLFKLYDLVGKHFFSYYFCPVKQPPFKFTHKSKETMFLLKRYHIVRFAFQLRVFGLQELVLTVRRPRCNFTVVTFQLQGSLDK